MVSNQSIPFSNKSKENQYKLNNEVQYRLNPTKYNNNTGHMYRGQTPGGSGGCSGQGWPGGGAHLCPCGGRSNAKVTEGKSPAACPALPLSLFWFLSGPDPLAVGGGRGTGEDWQGWHSVFAAPELTGWAGFLTQMALGTLGGPCREGGVGVSGQREGGFSSFPHLPKWNSQFQVGSTRA